LSPVGLVGAATESCVTVMRFPATVTVPVRSSPVLLRLTVRRIVPLPCPLNALGVIQSVGAVADHEHVAPLAVTANVVVPPVERTATEAGVTAKVQEDAAWLTV
jgi:hypothetical protein